jgi:Protein of unknown function (DUF2924)
MDKAAIDVAKALARLSELTLFELRGEWRRLHRMPPPMRFSRDLLTRGISYKLQERAYGGLSTATARKLERASADPLGRGAVKPAPPISLRSGTRLVREWRGVTHTVLIHADGIEWRGQRYRSLSVVAREITGARWSGPRFFGLSGSWTLPQARERAMAGAIAFGTARAKAMATAKPIMVMTNGATITAVKSCSILSTPKRGGCTEYSQLLFCHANFAPVVGVPLGPLIGEN